MREPAGDDPMQGMGAYLHRLGDAPSTDRLIVRAGEPGGIGIPPNDFPFVGMTPGSRWATLYISGARLSGRACVAPASDVLAGRQEWRCLWNESDAVQNAALVGDTVYMLQAGSTPNRRLLALDLSRPAATLADARELIAEKPDTVLSSIAPARDGLYLKSMQRGLDRLARLDPATGGLTPIPLPIEGSVYQLDTHPQQDGALASLEGWTVPSKLYRIRGTTLEDTGLGTLGAPAYDGLVA
jgi:prolyl oligopeptidase